MSVGLTACRIPEHRAWWWVSQYKHNVSAFNGYHYTPSDYSTVCCAAPDDMGPCDELGVIRRTYWRTKAAYVDDLPLRAPVPETRG